MQQNADRRSLRGLDWLNFFVANIQTGFGPFIAVYLTGQAWTETEIGIVLSIGTVAGVLSQIPAGALVDWMPRKRLAALLAALAIAFSAVIFAVWPARLPVAAAEVLHGFASCAMAPAIAALSLALVGRRTLGERLGRNARYAAIGNGLAAALMGAAGAYVSDRSVFVLTALLAIPGLIALYAIRETAPSVSTRRERAPRGELGRLLLDRRMVVFGTCALLFALSNAAMLPLAGSEATRLIGTKANLVIAGSILVPQIVVAALSPSVGRLAGQWGYRLILALGFSALPLRGVLLASVASPYLLVAVQALDGLSGAVFGVMLPLIAADVTRGTNRFNLCMGVLGLAAGIGATISTAVAGAVADALGPEAAFVTLALVGVVAVILLLVAMPDGRQTMPVAAPASAPVPVPVRLRPQRQQMQLQPAWCTTARRTTTCRGATYAGAARGGRGAYTTGCG